MELSFDEPAGISVFADHLISRGDPWGEVIAAQLAGHDELALKLIAEHKICAGAPDCTIEWKSGFARTVTIGGPPDPAQLRAKLLAFFALPQAQLCDGVVFAPLPERLATTRDAGDSRANITRPYHDCEDLWKAVPDRVTRFGWGAWPNPPAAAAYVYMPGFREVSGWFQRATEMRFVGADHDVVSPFLLPRCTKLELYCASLHRETIDALVTSELPVLEELAIGTGGDVTCILDDLEPPEDTDDGWVYVEDFPASHLDQLGERAPRGSFAPTLRFLADARMPALRRISLTGSILNRFVIQHLLELPYVKQLEEIDLRGCLYVKNRDELAQVIDQLRTVVSRVLVDDQPLSFAMRYVATME